MTRMSGGDLILLMWSVALNITCEPIASLKNYKYNRQMVLVRNAKGFIIQRDFVQY